MRSVWTNHRKYLIRTSALWAGATVGAGLFMPLHAAHATELNPTEIVVTARRTEEVIQNVPISMTVFNQEMLSERNVTNAADLVSYTPSLNVNTRFGSDQASFAIRGFTQDLATTASVAVYFADVVAPRAGGGTITAGDGAGPGAFFDLQNVQVLKGPQGTLFGRNTTGGAIQLIPQEPTNTLGGYLELSAGNYDMNRVQGVLNVPITDDVRARFGLDTLRRDGYLKNISGIGPSRLADVDYWAGRASVMWDVTDAVQNYTIATYTHSENNGSLQKEIACNTDPQSPGAQLGANFCPPSFAAQPHGFYTVQSDNSDPVSKLKQLQIINTTTWDINDDLTVKNILSFATLEQDMRGAVFGSNWKIPGFSQPNGQPLPLIMAMSGQMPGYHSNDQSTWVEELQLQGVAFDDKLNWQLGYYFENSRPNDWSGSQSPSLLSCLDGQLGADPNSWTCADVLGFQSGVSVGSIERNLHKQEFNNQAVYSQATYDITDEWRATLGLRYTVDKTHADVNRTTWTGFPSGLGLIIPGFPLPGAPTNAFCSQTGESAANGCVHSASQRSEAPTWLIDVDYLPLPDVMIYAKYARGYRQGNIVPSTPPGLDAYDPEKVDAYELGAKTSFRSVISGTFNIALFYNKLEDQQLQAGYTPIPGLANGSATTAIVNAGSSTIQGVEAETTLKLMDGLMFNVAYTYLDTRLDKLSTPFVPAGWAYVPTAIEGGHLTFSPRHTVVTGLSYQLPLPEEVGDISAGATYTFTSSQISSSGSPYGVLPARQLLNLNLGWKAIYGSPFDASFFMTNARDEKYVSYVAGLHNDLGAEFGTLGEPKMWGVRAKYNF